MSVEIWGKPACPRCLKAKQLCENRKLEYTYKELGKDFEREQVFENFPGARTFPQIKVNSQNVGGYEQFLQYLDDTGYNGTGYA